MCVHRGVVKWQMRIFLILPLRGRKLIGGQEVVLRNMSVTALQAATTIPPHYLLVLMKISAFLKPLGLSTMSTANETYYQYD